MSENNEVKSVGKRNIVIQYGAVLRNPKVAGISIVEDSLFLKGIVFILLNAITTGIFVWRFVEQLNALLGNIIHGIYNMAQTNEMAAAIVTYINDDTLPDKMSNGAAMPIGLAIGLAVLGSLVLSVLAILFAWLMELIFVCRPSFLKMISACGVSRMGKVTFSLAAILLGFINMWLGLGIFVLGGLYGFVLMCDVMDGACKGKKRKTSYARFLFVLISILVTLGVNGALIGSYGVYYGKEEQINIENGMNTMLGE